MPGSNAGRARLSIGLNCRAAAARIGMQRHAGEISLEMKGSRDMELPNVVAAGHRSGCISHQRWFDFLAEMAAPVSPLM